MWSDIHIPQFSGSHCIKALILELLVKVKNVNISCCRRVSTASSNFNSQCPSRTWSRRSSPTRGELLRADDEVVK